MRNSRARSLAERLIKEDTHVHVHVHASPEETPKVVAAPVSAPRPVIKPVEPVDDVDATDLEDLKEIAPKLPGVPQTPPGDIPASQPKPEVLSPGACSYVLRVKRDELGRISEVVATRL